MDNRQVFHAAAAQLTLGCMLASFYYLMVLQGDGVGWFFPAVLLPGGPVLYLLDRLFLRKPRSMLALVGLNAGLAAALCAASCALDGWFGFSTFIFVAAFVLILCGKGAAFALKPPTIKDLLLLLDGSLVLLVVVAAFLSLTGQPLYYGIPGICGAAAALLNVVVIRGSRPLGTREGLFLGGAFAAVFGGMTLLTGAAAPLGRGLAALWNGLGELIGAVFNALYRLLLYLTPPAPEYTEEAQSAAASLPAAEEAPPTEPSPLVNAILLAIVGLAVVAGALWLLRGLSRWKLGGRKAAAAAAPARRSRPAFGEALRALLARWRTALRTRRWLRRHRDTPAGVYFLLERRCRRSPWHKRPGETPRQFLTRLAGYARDDEQLCADLARLIPAADAALYGAAPLSQPALADSARRVRRRIGRTVRRQALRAAAARVRAAGRNR